MPELTRFFGIIIAVFYRDHEPAHFHAKFGEYEITVEIDSGIVEGRFPPRQLSLVLEWYELHKEELRHVWQLALERKALPKLKPLEK